MWINQLINLLSKARCLSLSVTLVPIACLNLAACVNVELEKKGTGDTTLQYFDFGPQYLFQAR